MFEGMSTIEILKLVAPLIVIQVGLAIFCLYRLTKDRVRFLPKWAWALIVIFVETIGPVVYLLIGRERD
jgi:hypothetical protein